MATNWQKHTFHETKAVGVLFLQFRLDPNLPSINRIFVDYREIVERIESSSFVNLFGAFCIGWKIINEEVILSFVPMNIQVWFNVRDRECRMQLATDDNEVIYNSFVSYWVEFVSIRIYLVTIFSEKFRLKSHRKKCYLAVVHGSRHSTRGGLPGRKLLDGISIKRLYLHSTEAFACQVTRDNT